MVRANELFTWNPIFLGQKEMEYNSDDDSDVGPQKVPDRSQFCKEGPNDDRVSDVEEVSETNFGDNSSIPINHIDELEKQQSAYPFNIYRLLRKQLGDDSHEGGSVLGVTEDMIRVGKAMGYSMDGCVKDLEQIIGTQGVGDGTQVAFFVCERRRFSRKTMLLFRTILLLYTGHGYVVIPRFFLRLFMLRSRSCFNPTSARVFDQFISASGLVDVKMEGYTFTWSHPSRSKMSKLDRFLVSEGIFLIFPSITVVCLDRHLSDHHPIILCEVQADFGLIPFRFYHSWISLEGFDAMVEQTWRSFSHNDANMMIRFKKKIQDLKVRIRAWIKDKRSSISGEKDSIKKEL
nr:RNA-directed DNA polymerase, eukaryota [Tanacetum cinerariifolium]